MSLYFGDRNISVLISATKEYENKFLNKSIIVTDEAEIPIKKLSGSGGVAELTAYLTSLGVTAPNLVTGVTKFLSQTDVSGNPIVPEYYYVIGKAEADVTVSVDLITTAIEAAEPLYDFYAIAPVFESVLFNEWFVTFGNSKRRIMVAFTLDPNTVISAAEQTERAIGIYDGYEAPGEFKNCAWLGRSLSPDSATDWMNRTLATCTPDVLTDAEVDTLESRGLNGYRTVRGVNVTTGSRTFANTSDNNSYIDTIIFRDNIVYNVAGALFTMFVNNEKLGMGDAAENLVRSTISKVLNAMGALGIIATIGKGYAYEVTVPTITSAMRSVRELTGVKFTYVQNVTMEKITVTGEELLEWV